MTRILIAWYFISMSYFGGVGSYGWHVVQLGPFGSEAQCVAARALVKLDLPETKTVPCWLNP